jgi:small subunit ribosomal protein S13
MARISGVELEDNLRIDYALTKLKGIGWSLSGKILAAVGIDASRRIADLKAEEISKIASEVEKYPIEGELARVVRGNITRLKQTGTYRGVRHSRGLPVRGQRTRTNARTKRGKRKTVGAFKKEVLAKTQAASEKSTK